MASDGGDNRIDLHAHSTASDGTLSPADVVRAAVSAGIDVLALTDHDTTAGWSEAMRVRPAALTLVLGVEISCRWRGVAPAIPLHLLGYLPDPEEPRLARALADLRASRQERGRRIVDLLSADGIDITWDEILQDAAGGTVGRPHVARALVRRGLVATVDDAFAPQWLGRRYRPEKVDLDVFEALDLVNGAGGVAVFAHPRASSRGRTVPDELIVDLAARGLAGLEADHPDHAPAEREHVHALARRLGLLVTGSSDFHGTNKTVPLGACLTAPAAYRQLVAAARGRQPIGPYPT